MMRARTFSKVKGTTMVNSKQVTFELKQQVLCALNKLADRDTYKIGVDELEKTIESLKPDGIGPFLSCILDTDAEQKSAVRKECIRLMSTLVNLHKELMGSHLGKIVASIVKRLKDPDTVVKDASVETFGVLASKMGNDPDESDRSFITLVKPLFEALGEQNKHVQSGAALCLARVIDCTSYPSTSILERMLAKTIKLLKNTNFMAKPAVIELNRSIIQAGGALTQSLLSSAMSSIQDALKNNDWNTRKAAAIALGNIGSNDGSFRSSFKSSCIHSLESCRFDKVKPVRDIILLSLHIWKALPCPDVPEPSEAGSSVKESYFEGDAGDVFSSTEFGSKEDLLRNMGTSSIKKNTLLPSRKTCQSYAVHPQQCKDSDWNIEIAIPRSRNVSLADGPNEEFEGSSITKTCGRVNSDVTSTQDNGFEYVSIDDGLESSSISNLVSDNFKTKFGRVSNDHYKEVGSVNTVVSTQNIAADVTISKQRYSSKMQDRTSLDSIVTESSSHTRGCCSQLANEMDSIREQLLKIEKNQSTLMELIKMFATTTTESLSTVQSKVSSLEGVLAHLAQGIECGGRNYDLAAGKLLKKCPNVASPRHSLCTPRPSVDIRNRKSSSLSTKCSDIFEENAFSSTRSSISSVTEKSGRKSTGKVNQRASSLVHHINQRRTDGSVFHKDPLSARESSSDDPNLVWKTVKDYLLEGNLDPAYVEALHSGDEHLLFELVDRTGPVLQSLSQKTASEVVTTLALFFVEGRYISSIISWLQQVVELSTTYGPNYLVLPAKVRREILLAIQEAAHLSFSNPADRRSVTHLAAKLHQIWGK